jgi:hypothetical protein
MSYTGLDLLLKEFPRLTNTTMYNHSRLYNELQDKIERDNWVRIHKIAGYSALIGIAFGIVLHIIINN